MSLSLVKLTFVVAKTLEKKLFICQISFYSFLWNIDLFNMFINKDRWSVFYKRYFKLYFKVQFQWVTCCSLVISQIYWQFQSWNCKSYATFFPVKAVWKMCRCILNSVQRGYSVLFQWELILVGVVWQSTEKFFLPCYARTPI